jgi:hypothetical protein
MWQIEHWYGRFLCEKLPAVKSSAKNPIPTLCNFKTSKDYIRVRQVRNSYLS